MKSTSHIKLIFNSVLRLLDRLGRRKSLVVFMSFATLLLAILAVLDLSYETSLSIMTVTVLTLAGKFGVAGSRSAGRMLTGE
jgi:hypothetical protein